MRLRNAVARAFADSLEVKVVPKLARDTLQVMNDESAGGSERLRRAEPRELQQARRSDGAAGKDHLPVCANTGRVQVGGLLEMTGWRRQAEVVAWRDRDPSLLQCDAAIGGAIPTSAPPDLTTGGSRAAQGVSCQVGKAVALIWRRGEASGRMAEPAIAPARDGGINEIAQFARNDAEQNKPAPGRAQPLKDLQAGVRAAMRDAADDHEKALVEIGFREAVPGRQGESSRRPGADEAEFRRAFVPQNEGDRAAA